jgi:SCF-associated factor 1
MFMFRFSHQVQQVSSDSTCAVQERKEQSSINPKSPTMKLTFLDLPQDVLEIIFLYLYPRSFLDCCSITKEFWASEHRNPTYWRVTTSTTFRIPISPLLHAEGDRWYWLYKKLRTQTNAFTWGQGGYGELGLPFVPPARQSLSLPRGRQDRASEPSEQVPLPDHQDHAWPSKMDVPEEVGVIADLQCGGWSTTLLSSQGHLYSVGVLDEDQHGRPVDRLTRLEYRSKVAIKSFSAGRKHVLGLDEEGYVWSWDRIEIPAWKIYDVTPIKASIVVAGWNVSSAYTKEGIIYWRVPTGVFDGGADEAMTTQGSRSLDISPSEDDLSASARAPVKTIVVPGTDWRSQQEVTDALCGTGQVLAYIVLEAYIVFITGLARVFACRTTDQNDPQELCFEVPKFYAPERQLKDIQGSFRKFSVFTATGEVLSGDQEYLDRLHNLKEADGVDHDRFVSSLAKEANDVERPAEIPALQHTGVISIAYGDYHFHALHSDGRITSYGHEPKCCGALGLGKTSAGARFRGVRFGGGNIWNRDAKLLPIGYRHGRQMWFSKEQEEWLKNLEDLIRTPEAFPHHHPTFAIVNEQEDKQAAYSEWVEQEGRAWEEGVENEDGLGSYFAISVAAAGWHSAALVLENTEMVEKVKEKWSDEEGKYVWADEPFPRIALPDRFEFPGSGELHGWRGGMPSLQELGLGEPEGNPP